MTRPGDDGALRRAMHGLPVPEPTDADVAEVLRRARARGGGPTRRLALAAAVLIVALAVLALPPGRSAIASMVGELQGFFQGGSAPGSARPLLDVDVILDDVAPGTSRALVGEGEARVVGFRQTGTGWPCIGLGSAASECAAGDNWASRTAGHAIVSLGSISLRASRHVVVWGLAQDGVATVDVIDSEGRGWRAEVGGNAFVAVLSPGAVARVLAARDQTGVLMERASVAKRGPGVCAGGGPCPSGG